MVVDFSWTTGFGRLLTLCRSWLGFNIALQNQGGWAKTESKRTDKTDRVPTRTHLPFRVIIPVNGIPKFHDEWFIGMCSLLDGIEILKKMTMYLFHELRYSSYSHALWCSSIPIVLARYSSILLQSGKINYILRCYDITQRAEARSVKMLMCSLKKQLKSMFLRWYDMESKLVNSLF